MPRLSCLIPSCLSSWRGVVLWSRSAPISAVATNSSRDSRWVLPLASSPLTGPPRTQHNGTDCPCDTHRHTHTQTQRGLNSGAECRSPAICPIFAGMWLSSLAIERNEERLKEEEEEKASEKAGREAEWKGESVCHWVCKCVCGRERGREGREDATNAARQQFTKSLNLPVRAAECRAQRGGRGLFSLAVDFNFFTGLHLAALTGHNLHSG